MELGDGIHSGYLKAPLGCEEGLVRGATSVLWEVERGDEFRHEFPEQFVLVRDKDAMEWVILVNGEGCSEGLTEREVVAVGRNCGTD